LSDQHPIERIPVVKIEHLNGSTSNGFKIDSKNIKTAEFPREKDVPIILDFKIKLIKKT
jgi:hypothetical protein